jgi:hypothetical protein
MLQEVKRLSDQNKFNSTQFKKTYPSFYTFRKILINKGLFNKKNGKEKWISIEPNIIMAKSIVRLYLERLEKLKEERNYTIPNLINAKINSEELLKLKKLQIEKNFKGKNPIMFLAKQIRKEGEKWNDAVSRASKIMKGGKSKAIQTRPLTMEETYPIAYAQDFETLKRKYEQLQDELEKTRQRLINQETANLSYKQRIEELEKGRAKKQTEKELYLEKTIDELRGIIREKTNEANGNLIEISILNENIVEKTNEINRNESLISNLREKIDAQNEEMADLEDRFKDYKKREICNKPEPSLPEPFFEYPSLPEPPIFERELTSQEKMSTPKGSKTYKLFGIPVFSINNK